MAHYYHLSEIKEAHTTSHKNRHILRDSNFCGCFHCLDIFDYKNIEFWCDDEDTALCPTCDIDSVIGSAAGFPITQEFLKAMQDYWFN